MVKLLLLYTIFSYGNFEFFTLIFWDTIAEITIFQGSVLERATLCSKRQIAIAMNMLRDVQCKHAQAQADLAMS